MVSYLQLSSMKNNSNSTASALNASFPEDYTNGQTTSVILATLLLISCAYILSALIVYEYWVFLKNKQVGRRKCLQVHVDKTADRMRRLCLSATVFSILRFIFEIIEIYENDIPGPQCNWLRHVKAVLQSGAFTCLYLVLWMRQRSLYTISAFDHLTGPVTRFFSWAMVVVMFIANFVTLLIFVSTRSYKRSNRGCVLDWSLVWSKLPGLFLFIFTTTFQAILLGLLIYPLCKHKVIASTAKQSKNLLLIRRVTIATAFAVVSTGLVSLLAITALDDAYGALRQVVYDVDILATLLAVIISFDDWRERLFPFTTNKDNVNGTVKRRITDQSTEISNAKYSDI